MGSRYIASILLLLALLITPANAQVETLALETVRQANAQLNPSLLFASPHELKEFGGHKLLIVSSLEILPPPQWVVAIKEVQGKQQAFIVNTLDKQGWNKLAKEANINLVGRKDYAKFPIQLLRVSAPELKAKWRFSERELARISPAGQTTIKQGWRSQRSSKGIIINFFSSDLLGNYSQWRLVVSKQGSIRSLKRMAVR